MKIVFVPAWAIERDPPAGLGDVPHRQLALDPMHAPLLEELLGAETDAVDELADVLAAGEPAPAVGRRPIAQLAVRLGRAFGWRAVPLGVADLLQPQVDVLVPTQRVEHRRGGLAGPQQR